jgi:hypothetical protein
MRLVAVRSRCLTRPFIYIYIYPLLNNAYVNNGRNRFITCTSGLIAKRCFLCGPCDNYDRTIEELLGEVFLCGPCPGVVSRTWL